jgi:polar amino acid transport system substrate-binding protein
MSARTLFVLAMLPAWAAVFFAPARAADHLDQIKQRGVLLYGADAEGGAPYVYPDPNNPNKLIGFEIEVAQALADKLRVRAQMVQNQWDQLIPALERGNFDLILNGLEITPENQQRLTMSRPYFVYAQQIMVRKNAADLPTVEGLRGKMVGVLSGSAAQRLLEKTGGVDVRTYPGNVQSFEDLKARRVDAVVLDLPIALFYARDQPELKLCGEPFATGYYGIGMLPADTNLAVEVNTALTALIADGTLETIYRKNGLWDERQEKLKEHTELAVSSGKHVSTLREWRRYLPLLLKGAVTTIELSLSGMALAMVAGLVIVLLRLYSVPPLTWLARVYVEVIRGTPLLIQLFLIYYGLPQIGIRLNPFFAGMLGLGLNYAASEAETYRAGIQSIPHGQTEAALALGMTRLQTLRHVILPQAFRFVIPPVTNDFIAMFKDSSIVSVIAMVELTKMYGMLAMSTFDYIGLGLMTAAIYLALSYPASLLAHFLERKLRYDHHREVA